MQYSSDRGQWDASPGIGVRRIGKSAIGLIADVRYHSLFTLGATADDASQPPEDDYWTLLAGVVVQF